MPKLTTPRITDAMIVDMARLAFEEERTHAEIAKILGISPAYVQKLLVEGERKNLFSVGRRTVTSSIDGQSDAAIATLDAHSQLVVTTNGTRVVIAVEMSSAEPQTTQMGLCGRTVTITIASSDPHDPA